MVPPRRGARAQPEGELEAWKMPEDTLTSQSRLTSLSTQPAQLCLAALLELHFTCCGGAKITNPADIAEQLDRSGVRKARLENGARVNILRRGFIITGNAKL